MHEKLQEQIKKDFPDLGWDSVALYWGLECGNGWFLLVHTFLTEASALCERGRSKLVVSQIKEKFGELNIHCRIDGDRKKREELFEMARRYETLSAASCQLCGQPGRIDPVVRKQLGWIMTLCPEHEKLIMSHSPDDVGSLFEKIREDACENMLARINGLAGDQL